MLKDFEQDCAYKSLVKIFCPASFIPGQSITLYISPQPFQYVCVREYEYLPFLSVLIPGSISCSFPGVHLHVFKFQRCLLIQTEVFIPFQGVILCVSISCPRAHFKHEDSTWVRLSIPLVSPSVWFVENTRICSSLVKMFLLWNILALAPSSSFTFPLNAF